MDNLQTFIRQLDEHIKHKEKNGESFGMLDLMPFFNVKGEPYSLDDHYMFEALFDMQMPRRYILKSSRQVGKSLNNAGAEVLKAFSIPNFRTLLICPRFEQIKRLSTLYVQPFITESLIKDMLVDTSCDQSILQRTYKNGSIQYFSFAFLDAERIRSIACDQVVYDEVQDLNWSFIPVIEQTMGGSKDWGMQRYAGTPKSLDNTIEKLWRRSSQDVWAVECPHMGCRKWNIGCADMDLLRMLGDRGPICAHCGKALPPEVIRRGGYISKYPDRVHTFKGQHVTQPLHPYYFEHSQIDKWLELISNRKNYPTTKFMNECLGEAHDSADRLMTSATIREMSVSERPNNIDHAKSIRNQYHKLAFGIDWGGGGDDSQSYTVLSIGGFRHGSDTVETIFAVRLSKNFDALEECAHIQMYYEKFKPDYIAHDFTGAGNIREQMLIGMGIPVDRLIPFSYTFSPAQDVITYNGEGNYKGTRRSYSMDKPRSLVVMCTMLKAGKITLPRYSDTKHLTDDLLNLMEERTSRPRGSDMILINTVADESDDFAHALNFMASSLWYTNGAYPEVAEAMRMKITIDQLKACNPTEQMLKDEKIWEANKGDTPDDDIPEFTPSNN